MSFGRPTTTTWELDPQNPDSSTPAKFCLRNSSIQCYGHRSSSKRKDKRTPNDALHPQRGVTAERDPVPCVHTDGFAKFRFDTRCQTDPAALPPGTAFAQMLGTFFPHPSLRSDITQRYATGVCDRRQGHARLHSTTAPFPFCVLACHGRGVLLIDGLGIIRRLILFADVHLFLCFLF